MRKRALYLLSFLIVLGSTVDCMSSQKRISSPTGPGAEPSTGTETKPAASSGHVTYVGSPLGMRKNQKKATDTIFLMRDSGIRLLHVQRSWAEVEKGRGNIDISGQFDMLIKITKRFAEFECVVVVVKMIDTNIRSMPGDLSRKPFDDPEVLERWDTVIDAFAKHPFSSRIDYFLVGNEVNDYFWKHPEELDAFETFYKHSVDRIHEKMPHLKVGTIHTFEGTKRHPASYENLVKHSDVVVYTYYPLAPGVKMKPVAETKADLEYLARLAGDKPFGFTEIGYASSPKSGSSEEQQADFVQQMFRTLDPYHESGSLSFLHFMMTFDPPPQHTERYAKQQGVDSAAFRSMMNSLGLISHETGDRRQGWEEFVSGMRRWRKQER